MSIGLGHEASYIYQKHFKMRYGKAPLPLTRADLTTLEDMAKGYGIERVKSLIEAYFQDDGAKGFFIERGHDIQTFRMSANRIWARASDSSKQLFLVGHTMSGHKVYSTNPNELKDTPHYCKPIPVQGNQL